jgi:ferrous iron transport protein A
MFFHCLFGKGRGCRRKKLCAASGEIHPLSECCSCRRVKVCKIRGDRAVCGRMASLGVLPGTILELLCPSRGHGRRHCMVKVNGSTLSLDELTADNIFVQSL